MRFDDIALAVPRIMLPRPDIDLAKWSVIACDQHTSNPSYWEQVTEQVGDAPSSLRLIYPEVHLHSSDRQTRIEQIRADMQVCTSEGVLQEGDPGFVLVDRQTTHAASRRGLMVALDLEQYSYAQDATTLIRTTEGTVLERLPPRIEVRQGAPLETPHILVLIDDPQRTVIEPLAQLSLPPAYDTELMFGGGRVRGWHVQEQQHIAQVVEALRALAVDGLLYAMGDGNHSFATAKEVWEQIKADAGGLQAVADHPARHALVELVNLHDEGLTFEPIHRVVFNVGHDALLAAMTDYYRRQGSTVKIDHIDDRSLWQQTCDGLVEGEDHHIPWVAGGRNGTSYQGILTIHQPTHELEAVSLQEFLDGFGEEHGELQVDYIHGAQATQEVGSKAGNVGLVSQVIDKHALFPTIAKDGPLPRKSFSLGEAEEKRYYLECRRLAEDVLSR
ncbi:MAG: DUF1015 domain-containing protein [Gemmatimonadetes bacterium]|jgi:hypothetical protein|nr:DUF1015 domain-containing protein [Gemmatimonadota bacterium]MBT4608477.1 DUF1015 domain-containing protein [Gemmatimonadota bacterium]MBT5060714.1 DUF1015 domain-containing protein [Gemmatimonadota bacterium]MBT5145377.1 DUF1015 domain-containing protein [Gemmatimonadota bacterium]MBT5591565.1 DUF1015 domain-containing protein [Gemmatimonadota bacterium]